MENKTDIKTTKINVIIYLSHYIELYYLVYDLFYLRAYLSCYNQISRINIKYNWRWRLLFSSLFINSYKHCLQIV